MRRRTTCLNTQELEAVKVYECVTVHGLVLFGENNAENVPSKPGLTKLEGCFVDEHGSIPLTLWNNDIGNVENNEYYLRKYSSTPVSWAEIPLVDKWDKI